MGEVRVEQRGQVLLATLDNPPHGLMDAAMVDGLEKLVAERTPTAASARSCSPAPTRSGSSPTTTSPSCSATTRRPASGRYKPGASGA